MSGNYIAGANVATAYPAATFEQDGKGFGLGDFTFSNGGWWVFVKAATALVVGNVVVVDVNYLATKITKALADVGNTVAVCPVIVVAANDFVWVQKTGVIANMLVLASCAIDVPLYTSATAGALDDTSTSQTKIIGAKLTTARSGTDGVAPALGFNGGMNVPL